MKILSSGNPPPSSQAGNPVEKIRRLLGDIVLIPVYPLTKKPIGKGWQERTLESMRDPVYLRSFAGKNIGVVLGRASGGLCTIDFDRDGEIEPFLEKNPRLRNTTRTKRVRGCNFWVYIDGEFPPSAKYPFGEWRADGNQTLIHGKAIDKGKGETEPTAYTFLNEVPPIHIRYEEIAFPDGCIEGKPPTTPPIRLNAESCMATTLHVCIPASLHNKADLVLANIKARRDALVALKAQHPQLFKLYTELIEPRYQAKEHARNAFIVQSVPFLYRAVSPQFILELVGCFYDCNRALFHDPREQHMAEAKAMLESVAKTYAAELGTSERGIYEALPEDEREAFRICRDLAFLPEPEREAGTFYLSHDHLGDRLGIFPMQAWRIMRQLQSYGLIGLIQKGTRRVAGVPSIATTYKWML